VPAVQCFAAPAPAPSLCHARPNLRRLTPTPQNKSLVEAHDAPPGLPIFFLFRPICRPGPPVLLKLSIMTHWLGRVQLPEWPLPPLTCITLMSYHSHTLPEIPCPRRSLRPDPGAILRTSQSILARVTTHDASATPSPTTLTSSA
jgi:hypothetical protein